MKIEKMKISDIKEYKKNAKLHPQWQIDQIIKSIEEFGFNDPIAVDEKNIIIEGHGRFEAIKQIGYKEVEIIKLEHLSEEQKKAYILAHNKLTMNTEFDIELLDLELFEIEVIDMADFGFEDIDDEFDEEFELDTGDKTTLSQITFYAEEHQIEQMKEKCEEWIEENEIPHGINKKGWAGYNLICKR